MDASTPTTLGWAGIATALAGFVVLLWRASRTDKDAQIASLVKERDAYQERERAFWKDREQANESRIRMAAALEAIAVRLAALEGKVSK